MAWHIRTSLGTDSDSVSYTTVQEAIQQVRRTVRMHGDKTAALDIHGRVNLLDDTSLYESIWIEDDAGMLVRFELNSVIVRFPVHCPICQQEWTMALEKAEILDALNRNTIIRVYAECHDKGWDLTTEEREKLAGYVKQ